MENQNNKRFSPHHKGSRTKGNQHRQHTTSQPDVVEPIDLRSALTEALSSLDSLFSASPTPASLVKMFTRVRGLMGRDDLKGVPLEVLGPWAMAGRDLSQIAKVRSLEQTNLTKRTDILDALASSELVASLVSSAMEKDEQKDSAVSAFQRTEEPPTPTIKLR